MRTISLELPDATARLLNDLTQENKEKLGTFVQFWLTSFASTKKQTALQVMKSIQQEVASKNLSKEEVQELINDSMS